ncbi:MAG: 30S ribosomal protein S6 [Janthinobacterium lividum]
MGLYENVFIARQDLSTSQVEALTDKFTTLIKENGGTVDKVEQAGLKALAYLIKKNRKGHYVLLNITAEPAVIKELERVMRLNEDLLRFLTVRVEEHEKGLSALSRASRSNRDDYGDEDRSESYSNNSEKSGTYEKTGPHPKRRYDNSQSQGA